MKLSVDECVLKVYNERNHSLSFWHQIDGCELCPLVKKFTLKANHNTSIKLTTQYDHEMEVRHADQVLCSFTHWSLNDHAEIVILLMIFVNNKGGGYVFFGHSPWFGYTIADCVFPFFMFIMGISTAFSLRSQIIRADSVNIVKVLKRIMKRTVLLFLLGLAINSMSETRLSHLRIPGVLQRFAICYLLVALSHTYSLLRMRQNNMSQLPETNYSIAHYFIDIYPYWFEWLFITFLSMIYFLITFVWNYSDNCPIGYQGPGGLYDNASHPNCTGGAARALDVIILGENHLYQGILGTATSTILVFLGLQAGKIFASYQSHKSRIIRWLLWGLLSGIATFVVWFNQWTPMCKNLWSFSFISFSAFLAFLLLTLLYILIDAENLWTNGTPFNKPGMNAIVLYVGHEVTHRMFPWYFHVDETSHSWLLFRSLYTTFLWFVISIIMANKRIFISL
ncbi:Heparan-alpha-glucosaminide N-acetyltransferase-like protein [Dinothrombium tinctorium]|uniref:Heparan-alpha-glucosaminide N-acetyltransferase-like protein n=1 Tax=Dinothrombium tinctorium TaxID=1965070 RepID=A0A443R5M9_9ACAR|nr:Heparan-alpha-glucosaminide N-acetyltransferase-like protein [Dinothrombium tinctorium]